MRRLEAIVHYREDRLGKGKKDTTRARTRARNYWWGRVVGF